MKKHLTIRLLGLLLTASVLLSSTGLMAMFASAEGSSDTISSADITTGSADITNNENTGTTTAETETTQPFTTAPSTSSGTEQNNTEEPVATEPASGEQPQTTAVVPETEVNVVTEGGILDTAGPTIAVEGEKLNAASQSVTWLGVDHTTTNMGKASNPYDVYDLAHFLEIQNLINDTGNADKYFRLTADIDLASVTISNFFEYAGFSGSLVCLSPSLATSNPSQVFINFDGDGYKIKNLNVTTVSNEICAIFGYLSANSNVYDINFENCSLTVSLSTARISAVVAAENAGIIHGCSFTGSTSAVTLNMNGTAGDGSTSEIFELSTGHVVKVGYSAFVGDNEGTIEDCYFSNISIQINKRLFVGAVAGQNSGTITGINGEVGGVTVTAFGVSGVTITAISNNDGSGQIGSITGKNRSGATLSACTVWLPGSNTVNSFTYGTKIGGITGVNAGTLSNCYSKGKVSNIGAVSSSVYDMKGYGGTFGGIAGENTGTINTSSAENIGVYFTSTQYAVFGGIAGTCSNTVSNSFSSGKVGDLGSVAAGYFLGGIVGSASTGTLLSSCYALVYLSENALLAGALIGNGAKSNMLSATYTNYWSRQISGWPTQCALNGSDDNDVYRVVKAINVAPYATSTLQKSLFTGTNKPSWGSAVVNVNGIASTSAFAETSDNLSMVEYTNYLEITGGPTAGTYGKVTYNLAIELPAGIGSTAQSTITQQFSFDTVMTSIAPASPVVSLSNPIVVSDATEVLLVKNLNYSHFKLGADITMPVVAPNDWKTCVFSGTLDGNNKTITTNKPIFSKIYGSRDTTVPSGGGSDIAANLEYGYVYALKIMLTANITTAGVMGSVMGGTVKNVTLTNDKINYPNVKLLVTDPLASNVGAFIDYVRGNSYIYGCFTDIMVDIQNSNVNYIGGLIGNINAEKATVENCGSNSFIYCLTTLPAIGSMVGGITANTNGVDNGVIQNCYSGGLVQRGGNIVVGNKISSHLLTNVYWSINDTNTSNQATVTSTNNISVSDTIVQWRFDETFGYVSEGQSSVNLSLPSAINVLANSVAGEYTVQVDTGVIIVGTLSISGGKLIVPITKTVPGSSIADTILTVTHNVTGLKARVTIKNGLNKVDGFWQIKTPGDLQYFSTNQNVFLADGTNCKALLVNDIDMTGYTYNPIGYYNITPAIAKPFQGVFNGNNKKISNLTITDNPLIATGQIAMFAYEKDATISALKLENASITCGNLPSTACLVAVASGGSIHDIAITDSTVASSYSLATGKAFAGGLIGNIISGNDVTVFAIDITRLTMYITADGTPAGIPSGGYSGGVVGDIIDANTTISDIGISDLNLTGSQYIGGVVGYQGESIVSNTQTVLISDVQITASGAETSKIHGSHNVLPSYTGGYVGGIVGGSLSDALTSKITACTVTGVEIHNTGVTLASTGATGGIAGWFSGYIGDDPGTDNTIEECVVTDCTILGLSAGGIVGKADTSSGNLAATVTRCKVTGTTTVTAGAGGAAGGIFGDFTNYDTLLIQYCVVQNGVTVTGGLCAGGILGYISKTSTASNSTTHVYDCQSFAAVSAGDSPSYAGGIIGSARNIINCNKITNCVAGGSVSAVYSAGGIVGYHSNSAVYVQGTGTGFMTSCYVTATLSGNTRLGKLLGYNGSTATFPNDATFADAFKTNVVSTYPQNTSNFGRAAMNAFSSARAIFTDINRPDSVQANYQHGSAVEVNLYDTARTATINVTNVPANGFTYVSASGWVTESVQKLEVTGCSATTVDVKALRSTASGNPTGVVAVYENSGVPISPDGTDVSLTFRARIPVYCNSINYAWEGAGTSGDPWLIKTKYDLDELRNHILTDENSTQYFGGYYKIVNDITFTDEDYAITGPGDFYNGGKLFTPIAGGTGKIAFVGSIDGNGKIISNLKINNTGINATYNGLFEQSGTQTIIYGGVPVVLTAEFKNLEISGADIQGDLTYTTHAGVLVGNADSTAFKAVKISNSVVAKVTTYAGGIAGYATLSTVTGLTLPDTTYVPTNVSGTTVTVSAGMAGGIAGRFGGTIGETVSGGFAVSVSSCAINGYDAGGLVGCNYQLSLNVLYALVSGGSVTSAATSDSYAVGGIIGRADGTGNYPVSITYTKVDGTAVTAVCLAGGIIGKMGVVPTGITNMLLVQHTESYAAVQATATTGTGYAGGIVAYLSNPLIVQITDGVAGGSVTAYTYIGGIVSFIETNALYTLDNTGAINSLMSNFVVSALISSSNPGAKVGLVLGYTHYSMMPENVSYTFLPIVNIKYSSYQYVPGGFIIGNGTINGYQTPNFKETVYDLNKGYADTWTDTYRGMRHFNGAEDTLTVVLGNDPVVLTDTNVLLPLFTGSYGFNTGSTFANFTDTQNMNFTLSGVTSNKVNLVSYNLLTNTLSRGTSEGGGDLRFTYANGLIISLKVIAYSDLEGIGTPGDPYQIKRTGHFDLLRVLPSKYFEQMNDIAFTVADFQSGGDYYNSNSLWEPVKGSGATVFFTGQYNGGGYTISGMKINRPTTDYVGFFAKISNGKIYNLTIANAIVTGSNYVGVLAGETTGSGAALSVTGVHDVHVLNCAVSTTTAGSSGTPVCIGGLVGVEKSTVQIPLSAGISGCTVTSTTVTTGNGEYTDAGGIAAKVQSVENCVADNVTVTAGYYAGGIAARSSITVTGDGNPLLIKNCTVTGVSGISQITANYSGAAAVAGGIMAYMDKVIQLTIESCLVSSDVVIKCGTVSAGGGAGGIMGFIKGQNVTNTYFTAAIKDCESYASVIARNEAGGVLSSIKGVKVQMANMLIEGCVGGGEVQSLSTGAAGCAGGIIGGVNVTSGVVDTTVAFIKDCIASASLSVGAGTRLGKFVGDCTSINYDNISDIIYPTVFNNNYYSSFPQDKEPFGDQTMSASQYLGSSMTDVMLCKQITGNPLESMTVRNLLGEEFSPVAIATFGTPPVTTNFEAEISIWNGAAPADLVAGEPYAIDNGDHDDGVNPFHALAVSGITATTSAAVTWECTGEGAAKAVYIGIRPTNQTAGYIEAAIGYGLTVSIPLVTFDINGTGLSSNPFQITTAQHLTLMYYLNKAYFKQMNDITVTAADYAAGTYNAETEEYDGRGVLYSEGYTGFRPVGSFSKPFTGSYNGQNFRISGIYSTNKEMDYIGFFGYVSGNSALENIHIELMSNVDGSPYGTIGGMNGRYYVGGLAGYCDSETTVRNCSVAFGQVAGRHTVGGLIGESSTSISDCFTDCDVLAVGRQGAGAFAGEAGGLIGNVYDDTLTHISISSCFATGSIYSGNQHAGGLVGVVTGSINSVLNVTDAFFTGNIKSSDESSVGAASILFGSGDNNIGIANCNKAYVAGTNTSFKSTMLPVTSQNGTKTNIYFDSTVLGLTTAVQGTAKTTGELSNGTLPTGFLAADWTVSSGSYPRLIMADNYSNAFCALAALPLQTDAKELQNSGSLADGALFQTKIANTVNGSAITATSSKLDISDTLAYPSGYDADLYGNGADRAVDMLFGNTTGNTITIYRNIFATTAFPLEANLLEYKIERGELWYDCKTPVVTLTASINGFDVSRRIKIPLETAANHYYLATERQLRTLSTNYETTGKFSALRAALNTYDSTVNLTADTSLRGEEFEPILSFKGVFNGNDFTVGKLKIITKSTTDYVGMFNKLESSNAGNIVTIKNINLKDVWISGKNYVGALTGKANNYTLISNCHVYPSGDTGVDASYVTGNTTVGGLLGWAQGTITAGCRSAVEVTGVNTVGGLVGLSAAVIDNSYATGNVTAAITSGSNIGIGGFAGFVSAGSVNYAFASGNVLVSTVDDFTDVQKKIGVGGFIGTVTAGSVLACFASGNVRAEDVGTLKNTSAAGSLQFGVGGFTGINDCQLTGCYSSSSVFAEFTGEVLGVAGGVVSAGVGGVSGIASNTVSDAYSSGSVFRETSQTYPPVSDTYTYYLNAIGGVIGTTAGNSSSHTLLYFDIWNSSYGSSFKAIGGQADTEFVRSLTTDQLTISQALRETGTTPLKLSTNYWSFNSGAYPCLLSLVQQTVSPYIRYPAVLSCVAVIPNVRDTSARTGFGITMAITTPNSLTVLGQEYLLDWSVSAGSEVRFLEEKSGSISTFIPIRTTNESQILSLVAEIKDNSLYGSRGFDRLCAQMLGTETKPYLVSNKSDLQHIALPQIAGYYDITGFENFYNTWYSPVTITGGICTNVAGKVYFKLLSDINMVVDVNYTYSGGKLTAVVNYDGDTNNWNDNHHIGQVPANYGSIPFQGISFAGNDYTIKNFTSDREFIYGISAASDVRDVGFENLNIDTDTTDPPVQGTASTALVLNNLGTIDGCMIISGSITSSAADKVAGIVANNYATLTNSIVNADITGKSNVGGITAINAASGSITKCAYTGGTIIVTQDASTAAYAGGIAGKNSGGISNCYTMGSISSTNGATAIGGLTGENAGAGIISAAYSRTAVNGGDNIGGFAGTNAGSITNAFSAGKVTVSPSAVQSGIFCGTNSGILTDCFADKALSGSSTYKLLTSVTRTENITEKTYTEGSVFTASSNATAYPQLKAILALDNAYGTGIYIPQKYQLLIGGSAVSSATLTTKYSQYIDTLALSTANTVSSVSTPEAYLTDIGWTSSNSSIISDAGATGASSGSATLTAGITVSASNGKTYIITLPVEVATGGQNPNFAGGNGANTAPYQIDSVESFNSLSYYGFDEDNNYIVTADINYANDCPAVPITVFNGHLDGQKNDIYDVTVDNNSGLFGLINTGATLINLGLVGAKTTTASTEGYAGLLAGHAQGAAITNCYAVGEISLNAAYVGGLVGLANDGTTISGCMTSGTFTNTSASGDTGGIAACADTLTTTGISGCFSTAYVQGNGNTGGIVGEVINSSMVTNCTYAGMVMDTALASGASAPFITTIGNITGSKSENSAITGCYYDKQITLISDANATAEFTAELMTGSTYTFDAGLSGGSDKFTEGVAFGVMPVRFLLGTAAGSTEGFSTISLPQTINGDHILVAEIPQHPGDDPLHYYLSIGTSDPIIITLADEIDLADVYAGLRVNLDTGTGTEFTGMTNQIKRFVQPRLARIIKISYTMTNSSGLSGSDPLAVVFKNKHIFAGEPVTYSSDAFTTAASAPSVFEDLVVTSGAIYAAGMLPAGYNYQISADQYDNTVPTPVLLESSTPVMLETTAGEYGCYIDLNAAAASIVVHYTIMNNAPWGVYKLWNSLADTLVRP